MKPGLSLLVILLATALAAVAQSNPSARPTSPASRAGQGKEARSAGPDPDLFDGTKFDKENRPETGMMGEFEMPGSNEPQDKSKVGGNPGQPGGNQDTPPKSASSGGASAAPTATSGGGGAESAAAAGKEGASGGGSSAEKSGSAGAVGGALDQSKPMSDSGQSGGGGPTGKAEGVASSNLQGGASSAAQNSMQGPQSKPSVSKIGSAELRIEPLPESDKDVIGREAAPGGTQGSNRPMPNGNGSTGSTNQNKGVEKGKVIPKGL